MGTRKGQAPGVSPELHGINFVRRPRIYSSSSRRSDASGAVRFAAKKLRSSARASAATPGCNAKPLTAAIGKPNLRVHDLRHVGAVFAAQSGATTAELMHRLGHTTPQMALKYQHVAEGRDAQLAERMSKLATGVDA